MTTMTVKRAMRQVVMMVCGLGVVLGAQAAVAGDAPTPLADGAYKCQISKEYKFRKCEVRTEGNVQTLKLTEEGHLLMLSGPVYASYTYKDKKNIFAEVSLTGDKPYICGVKDEAAREACKAQKPIIHLQKKGSAWVGEMIVKHYMDTWAGQGKARAISGYEIKAEPLRVTIKK